MTVSAFSVSRCKRVRNRRREGIDKVSVFAFATTETLKGQLVETIQPSHFLNALAKVGVKNVRVIGSRRSRVDLHIDDLLLEAEKDGLVPTYVVLC